MPTINQLVRKPRVIRVVKSKVPALKNSPQKTRSLHARLHDDAEEAEFGPAQGRARAPDQRL